jgi:hypothetical protein
MKAAIVILIEDSFVQLMFVFLKTIEEAHIKNIKL